MTTSLWILGDQLLPDHPGLPAADVVIMVEADARLRQQPYHRRKLALVLSAMRHYVEELQDNGHSIDVRRAPDFLSGLHDHVRARGVTRLLTMAAAEYDTRQLQQQLERELGIPVELLPNDQFLVEAHPPSKPPKLMEPFYRSMRRATGLLLDSRGEPEGGRWNFDADNRKGYDGRPVPPPPSFPPDVITRQAIADAEAIEGTIGTAQGFDLPVTRAQALQAMHDFIANRLPNFGPFEDAMSAEQNLLFHSQLSPLVNLGLLRPFEMAQAAEQAYRDGQAPLASVEGFVRQVIGWREYIYYRYWEHMPAFREVNSWQCHSPLPSWFWSGKTNMRCMQHVIDRALASGYAHHIERLMLVCNFSLLAALNPQEVNAWFLACFIDAYDWVMVPNVLGMGLNADGGITATKPYIASASYINKMSDYCKGCAYNHKQRTGENACPFNTLYWNFLIQHEQKLRANPRLGPAVLGLSRLDSAERAEVQQQAASYLADLDNL